jgi:hypothetical protein
VRVPVELLAPAWGDYSVFGTVYGPATPVRFSAGTSNEPWGLELALPLLLLVGARIVRRSERKRRETQMALAAAAPLAADPGHALLQESSPAVGSSDDEGLESPAYDPLRGERVIDLSANGVDGGVDPDRVVTTAATRT